MELVHPNCLAEKYVSLRRGRRHIEIQQRPLKGISMVRTRQDIVRTQAHRNFRDAVFQCAFLMEVVPSSSEGGAPSLLRIVRRGKLAPTRPYTSEPPRRKPKIRRSR